MSILLFCPLFFVRNIQLEYFSSETLLFVTPLLVAPWKYFFTGLVHLWTQKVVFCDNPVTWYFLNPVVEISWWNISRKVFPFFNSIWCANNLEATTGTSSTFLLNPLKQLQGSLILCRIYFSHMIWPWHSGLNCVNECCKSEIKHAPLTRATALNHERDNFLFSEELRTNPIC